MKGTDGQQTTGPEERQTRGELRAAGGGEDGPVPELIELDHAVLLRRELHLTHRLRRLLRRQLQAHLPRKVLHLHRVQRAVAVGVVLREEGAREGAVAAVLLGGALPGEAEAVEVIVLVLWTEPNRSPVACRSEGDRGASAHALWTLMTPDGVQATNQKRRTQCQKKQQQ